MVLRQFAHSMRRVKYCGWTLGQRRHQVQLRRLAGRYNQTGTATGRLCMGDPNFMCMPRPRDLVVPLTQLPCNPDATQHRPHQANVR